MGDSGIGQRMLQARLDLAQRLGREVPKSEIAAKLEMPTPTYGRYENGTRKVPSELLQGIAVALQTDVAYLVGGAKRPAGRRAVPGEDAGKKKA